ncbi:MAG: DUF4288 domain-containing protein [Candidatus Saccharibacteria bacterium]
MRSRSRKRSRWEWYSARILYEINISGKVDAALPDHELHYRTFEESIIVIKAQSIMHAHRVAEKKALEYECSYPNCYGEKVEWKFSQILDVIDLFDNKIETGTEIYYRIVRVPQEASMEEVVRILCPEMSDVPETEEC